MGLFFSIGKCVILVEHISTVVLDTKVLYYRKEADKCPQAMRSDINHWLTARRKNLRKFFNKKN